MLLQGGEAACCRLASGEQTGSGLMCRFSAGTFGNPIWANRKERRGWVELNNKESWAVVLRRPPGRFWSLS